VGGDFDYPPFSYIDKTGKASGLDIDILNAISEDTGIAFEYELSEWDSALTYIQTGKTDIITGIIFSEEREAILDFTNPLHTEYYSIFIRKNLQLKEISDLYNYKLMVLKEDISIDKFLIPMGLYHNYIVAKSLPEAIAGIEWGRADFVIAPHSLGMNEISKNNYKNVQVKGPPIIPSIYCMAVKKGNTHLLAILNKSISDLRANGELEEIHAKWKVYERNDFKYERIARNIGIVLLVATILFALVFMWVWLLRKQIKIKTENIKLKNQKLQKLNAEKDRFLSIIAHDLRNPFNSIIGFGELLVNQVEEDDMENVLKYSKVIMNASKKAMDLLTNLMEWSLSQTGRLEYNPEYFEIDEAISKTLSLFWEVAEQKSIKIEKNLIAGKVVYADKEMIRTVLRNLISNAIKFTRNGGLIKVQTKVNQNKVEISVKDSGVGLSESAIDKLFRLDENISSPGTLKEQGTGLGLILCKEFIDKHNERIWLESEPGKGAVFYFTLHY
jgi:signal transduction histidine kinase